MKQAEKLPTLTELDSLLDAPYWKAHGKELLTLKKAAGSLASLAEAAHKLNTKTPFHTPKPYFRELYALIIAVHQDDAKALRLQAEIKFKISVWHWEQQLTLALQSQDIATQSKACLELGLLYQHSSEKMRYEQALSYFSKTIKLGYFKESPVALRKRADLYLEQGKEDLGLQDLEALCHLIPDNPRAQIEYGQALMVAERHLEAAKAAEQALRLKPNDPAANDLLQMAQRHLSARTPHGNVEVSDTSPKHKARDELHAIYLKRLTSNVPSARQDGFSQLMAALEPCKREIKSLLEVMNPANFEQLLASAPAYFDIEMPSHADTLQSGFKELHARFEDCLVLYLVAKSFMSAQHQIKFYYNMSRVLAQKGYYYQDAAVKNTGNPVDALDYALLALPYDSPDLLPLYARGAEQIVVEYHYQQGIAVLKLATDTLQNYEKTLKVTDIEAFLGQFKALLKVANASRQYPNSTAMQVLKQGCCRYLSSPALLAAFETTFRFKLKHHATDTELLKKDFPALLELINTWGQHDSENAKKGLRLFNGYLAEKKLSLSKDIFYTTAIEKINVLLLQFEQNQSLSTFSPEAQPDMTRLIQETRKRFAALLTIRQDLNTHSVIALQKKISEEATVILNGFLSAIENTLGPAPSAFSILGLGSYSREEMGLCSDIDFAILVSDESAVQHPYFKSFLSLLVHLRRGLPPNVLTIESKDLQTLFGQEKSLMHTPLDMVSEHCPLYTETEIKSQKDRLTNTESYSVRRARLIFNSQTQPQESKALYEDYQSRLTAKLQNVDSVSSIPYYQMVGQVCLEEDFKKHDGAGLIDTTETTAINLKKTHLRPLTLWLLNVATYFGIEKNNSWEILEALNQQSRIAPMVLQEVGEALTYLHTLRLKLHQAWLTQPKPSESPFDAWLEMPIPDNSSPFTRDFYLDANQRKTLEAIQRRIIEPLTETISVFSAILPPPQFDPVVHYFEMQFKALNQKHIVESHSKTLPILAEIALRRPHLLTPSLAFRDLSPPLKVAYLDALEVALQNMERAGSVKEIAELKALVQTLWHTPTEDGWRAQSFRQERTWNQQLMYLLSKEVPSPTSNTLSIVQGNRIKHYALKPEIISQFFTGQGEWLPKDEKITGNHLVYRITDKTATETLCWAKVYPEQPGIEWLMWHLDQRLGIYGIPASTLVNIHHNGRNSAVLLSADVPHPNLFETLKTAPQTLAHLDRAHFFKTLMRVLLTNPEDDKGNDYFLEAQPEGFKLLRIDNERAFFTAESSGGLLSKPKLQVKSILYCLDLLMEPLKTGHPSVDAAIRDFLQLKPYALLKSLVLDLKALQPLWQFLFSEADIEVHYHNKKPWLSLPVLYVPQELVKELSVRMESLQTLLALNPKTTGLKLLNTVQPKLAAHYLEGFKQHPNNQNAYSQVMTRFDLSPGRHYKKQEQGLFSLHGTEAVTQSLRLSGELSLKTVKSIWQGITHNADTVLAEIEHWEADRSKDIYTGLLHSDPTVQRKAYIGWQQLSNRQRVLLFKDFSSWAAKNPNSDIRLQQAILSALPNTTFHTLDLSAFSQLEDKFLTPILKSGGAHLIELNLSNCQKLSDAIPAIIAEHCPNLKILNASNMAWKSFSGGRVGRSAIAFPNLEQLEMQNCTSLEYFMVEAPRADINLQDCTALKQVQFSADLSFVAAKQLKPGEYQYQLAKAYSLGTGVSKNLIQAYYWAQLSFEKNHPSASELCGECAYIIAKSHLLGDGMSRDINQAYHWARLSREYQHPLSEMLCYALFNFYPVIPINGNDERLSSEKSMVSLVGAPYLASIQTLKNVDVRTLELGNINESGLRLLSFALRANNTLAHLDLRYNKIGVPDAKALAEAEKTNGTTPDSAVEELLTQCERLAALSLDAAPITYLGKSGLLSTSPLILPHLRSLTLQNLDKLTRFLLQMPQLTSLQLVNVSLKQLGNTKAPLVLPQLTTLVLKDLPQLIDVTLEAPQLRQLEMRHCDALDSLETQSEHARTLLDKGIALSAEEPKQATEHLDSALSLEPNHILRLIEIEQSLSQSLPDYISHYLRATPEVLSLTPQFRVAQKQGLQPQLNTFLRLVAEGEQDKAEALLQKYPALGLYAGNVTDLSKRSFKNITALQYALWSLDWHMWTMLLKYIPQKDAAEQITQSERGLWVPQHGITANWENLIQALNQYVSEVRSNKPVDVYKQTWIKQVGGAQLLLPAHVINEYCHPTRPFDPVPDFSKPGAAGSWRTCTTDEGEWFSAKYGGGTLGEGFAVYRGNAGRAVCACLFYRYFLCAVRDSTAVAALLKTRASQRAAVVAQYLPKPEPARRVTPSLSAGSLSQ